MPDLKSLLHWAVGFYVLAVILVQVGSAFLRRRGERRLEEERRKAGLDQTILADHALTLETVRHRSWQDAIVLLISIVGLPPLLVWLFSLTGDTNAVEGLSIAFLTLIIWIILSTTDLAKAFLGGIAFRAFIGFRRPFQVGDRVTLMGHSGKVVEIGPFHVRMVTPDDDLVSIPSAALWSQPLVSANAGDRASLCVMEFHLAPFVTKDQRQAVEDRIWDAIQCSLYWAFDKPVNIFVEQRNDEIVLIAKAYVASTYNEFLFRSDVTQAFLDFADEERIPLASSGWRRWMREPDETQESAPDR